MDWADALDATQNPQPFGALRVLANEKDLQACKTYDEARVLVREGFRSRLVETPGVVATSESWDGASLVVAALKMPVPKIVEDEIKKLHKTWEIGGEEIEDGMRLAEISKQLSVGFHYRWVWPTGEPDREWLRIRAEWHKQCRLALHGARSGMDSPLLVTRAIERGQLTDELLVAAWSAWKAIKERYNPTPPVEAVWTSDFAIKEAVAWGNKKIAKKETGIIWYLHGAVGEAVAKQGGFPLYDAGTDAGEADPRLKPVIVCSIRAQGTGKNLQSYAQSLVVEPPSAGATWEQLLGRTHRPGQVADEVWFEVFTHTQDMEAALYRSVEDALYVLQTQGQRQKLLTAQRVGW
jgi:hypothetical protein